MASAFLSDPMRIYALRGRGDRAAIARAGLLERLLNLQALWFKHDLSYMTFWNDMFCYGLGAVIPEWSKIKRRQTITSFADEAMAMMLRQEGKMVNIGDMIKSVEEKIVAEGNKLTNCSVRNVFLDPSAPLHEQDRGEFCGYIERVNVFSLVERAKDPEERLDLKACRYLSERSAPALTETSACYMMACLARITDTKVSTKSSCRLKNGKPARLSIFLSGLIQKNGK